MKEMTTIQREFLKNATEKARLRNVTVNGKCATVAFLEYNAPDELKEKFKEYDHSDGHFYYITWFVWNGARSYYTDEKISSDYSFLTSKEEGNEIYKQLKTAKTISIKVPDELF